MGVRDHGTEGYRVRQRRSYGRLSTGIRKSVCYEALPFVRDFRSITASDFYPGYCKEFSHRNIASHFFDDQSDFEPRC